MFIVWLLKMFRAAPLVGVHVLLCSEINGLMKREKSVERLRQVPNGFRKVIYSFIYSSIVACVCDVRCWF